MRGGEEEAGGERARMFYYEAIGAHSFLLSTSSYEYKFSSTLPLEVVFFVFAAAGARREGCVFLTR